MTLTLRVVFIFLLSAHFMFAQEVLRPLSFNANQYHIPSLEKSNYIYNNIVITSDTLSLPFFDDFSKNTLLPYDFANTNISDTVFFAAGECINNDFDTKTGAYMLSPSFDYFYDTTTNQLDSIALAPVNFTLYDNTNDCFPVSSGTFMAYPRPYVFVFDTITGEKLDSTQVIADTTFQYATIYYASAPSNLKWLDNFAFINTTFPDNPPTIGVATLDGLNENGLPYNNSFLNAYGDADVLTSKPIDLSGLSNDSALFLSFFVQAEGLGDAPNNEDSLVLEFKNEYENQWVNVWATTTVAHTTSDFKQYYVPIRDTNLVTGPRYFYEDFQFRFRNKASVSGNNDHWHIDYIRLDKNRAQTVLDTVIRDVAFMYDFPNVLQRYTALPWSQFQAGADEFADSINIPIRDNGQLNGISAGAFPIQIYVTDSLDLDTIYSLTGVNFNPTSEIKNQVITPISDFVKPVYEGDSILVNAKAIIEPTARNFLSSNDTTTSQIIFDKVMAYDDGTAERAYGLEGSPGEIKKFAYKFAVAHPDTLAGIQIHFSSIDENVDDLIFNLYVWDSLEIGTPLSYENEIASIENLKPEYSNMINGFVTFAFDTPILVTDDFYIGFSQTDSRNLQIGFDKNSNKGKPNMFIYANSTWNTSGLVAEGSPMIRALLDADFDFTTAIINRSIKNNVFKIYPNPTSGFVQVDIPSLTNDYTISVQDISGKVIINETNTTSLNLSDFPSGMYFVKLLIDGEMYYNKIVKK